MQMSKTPKHTVRPTLACEISAGRILVARSSDDGRSAQDCGARDLPAGSITPDLMEPNLHDTAAIKQAIQEMLSGISGRGRDVVAILPDAAVRVALLDFDTLPSNHEEAEAVVRFRLKKSLPFEIEKAKVSYQAQTLGETVRVVAVVALQSVLEEYETVFREAGYNPGVVMPSMLAALGAADAQRPTLVVKFDGRTIGIAILDKEQLLLFRTLENMHGAAISGEQLAEEIYPSVVFFQDTYHLNIERICVAGMPDAAGVAALQAQTGIEVQELVQAGQLVGGANLPVPSSMMAGVLGALIS